MGPIETRLRELGYSLPEPPKPVASYLPAVVAGDQVVVSGQLPFRDGSLLATGPVPSAVSEDQARAAAAQCAVNALAALSGVLGGDWARLIRIVRVGVFVQSDPGYGGQPGIANGASDLLAQVLGEAGRHARAAVGVNALPLNASVEVELIAQVTAAARSE